MTPTETLDWLAQQHYEQCREARPIQDWIRKMKTQLPENNTAQAIKSVLTGIDQTEIESPEGWWETSTGAEFGQEKLEQVLKLVGGNT